MSKKIEFSIEEKYFILDAIELYVKQFNDRPKDKRDFGKYLATQKKFFMTEKSILEKLS